MQKEQEDLSLDNLAMGGVVERFNDELKKVLADIWDPNTTLEKREITLKVSFKPDQNRDFSRINVSCHSKLAKSLPIETKCFIAVTKDGAVATEYNPCQGTLDLQPEKAPVTHIRVAGGIAP